MAFAVDDRVKIATQHSQWRNAGFGTVKQVLSGSKYAVQLDGHGCGQTQTFDEDELKATGLASTVDYSRCA